MGNISYFEIDGAPKGKMYFRCEAMHATLSVEACAANWRRAHAGEEGCQWRCKGCKIGALHAGETAANLWFGHGQTICARCHRGAVRLIGGDLCVSCYNREREWRMGANAKGRFPTKMKPLGRREVMVHAPGQPRQLVRKEHSRDLTEIVISILRDSPHRVTFGWHGGSAARLAQIPLF